MSTRERRSRASASSSSEDDDDESSIEDSMNKNYIATTSNKEHNHNQYSFDELPSEDSCGEDSDDDDDFDSDDISSGDGGGSSSSSSVPSDDDSESKITENSNREDTNGSEYGHHVDAVKEEFSFAHHRLDSKRNRGVKREYSSTINNKDRRNYMNNPPPPPPTAYGKDICEASPNNRAKCKECRLPIKKGDTRVGKWTYLPQYTKYQYQYYHERCVTEKFKAALNLPDPKIKQDRNRDIATRQDLRKTLRSLRMAFARQMDVAPYYIFNDKTLDDITVRLPQTKNELLACYGIAEKRYQNFGSTILHITAQYARSNDDESSNDNDGTIIGVTKTFSCQEIVNRKFRHAEENGYIIKI